MSVPIRAGLLHVPTFDKESDESVRHLLSEFVSGMVIVVESSGASQRNWVEEVLRRWCDEEELDLVLTIGGTLPAPGPGAEEIAPDATEAILDRQLPGIPEAMRAYAQAQTNLAMLDRGMAGIRGRTLLINLPAGSGPATLFLEAVIDLIRPTIAHLQEDADAPRLADIVSADVEMLAGPEGTLGAMEADEEHIVPAQDVPAQVVSEQDVPEQDTSQSGVAEAPSQWADEFGAFLQRRRGDADDDPADEH